MRGLASRVWARGPCHPVTEGIPGVLGGLCQEPGQGPSAPPHCVLLLRAAASAWPRPPTSCPGEPAPRWEGAQVTRRRFRGGQGRRGAPGPAPPSAPVQPIPPQGPPGRAHPPRLQEVTAQGPVNGVLVDDGDVCDDWAADTRKREAPRPGPPSLRPPPSPGPAQQAQWSPHDS